MVHIVLGKSNISEETQNKQNRREKGHRELLLIANYVWLSGRTHIGERLDEGPRVQ